MAKETNTDKKRRKKGAEEKFGKKLMRFTSLRALFEILEWGGIPLFDDSRWPDRCDQAYLERGCRELKASRFGVMCFMDPAARVKGYGKDSRNLKKDCTKEELKIQEGQIWETSAHWEVYSREGFDGDLRKIENLGVSLKFDSEKLRDLLKKHFDWSQMQEGKDWFFRGMDYQPFGQYRQGMTLDGRLAEGADWFFLKRNAFEWEQERRLIVLNQYGLRADVRRGGATAFVEFKEEEDWSVLESLTFSPACREETEAIRKLIMLYAQTHKERFSKGDRLVWLDRLLKNSHKSRIYDNTSVISFAEGENPSKRNKAVKTAK